MERSVDATSRPLSSILKQYVNEDKIIDAEVVEIDEVSSLPSKKSTSSTHSSTALSVSGGSGGSSIEKTVNAVSSIIEEYNNTYNIKLPTTTDDIRQIITEIASRSQRDLYAVVLSEVSDRIILSATTSLLVSITTMISDLSSEASMATYNLVEKIGILDRFMNYIKQLLEIQKMIGVDNPKVAMNSALRSNKDSETGTKESMNVEKIDQILDILKERK